MKRLICHILMAVSVGAIACLVTGCSVEKKEARCLKRANQYYEAKQFDKAQVEYLNVVGLNSRNVLAWMRLGLIASDKSDLQLAYKALVRAKGLTNDLGLTNSLVVRAKLGKVYLSYGMLREARKEALFVLEKDPLNPNPDAILVLGGASQGPEEVKDAFQRFEKLPKVASETPTFHLASAYLFLRQTNLVAAEAAYRAALDIEPRATAALVGLGDLYREQNRLTEARIAFKAAAELMPLKSNERLRWANFEAEFGDAAEAKRILKEMAAKITDSTAPSIMLAEIALKERRFEDARALVAKLLKKDSRNLEAIFLNARIKIAQGKLGDGVKDLENLAEQYPGYAKLQYELAVAEAANNDLAKADVAIKKALKANSDPNYFEARLLQAKLDLRRGNLAPAITSLELMTNQQPRLVDAYFLLASGYVQQGSSEDALSVYQKLSGMVSTNDDRVPFLAGLVYRQQRKNTEARRLFKLALERNRENVPALYNLIELDVAEKDFASALKTAESMVGKDPNAPEPLMILARIHRTQGDTAKAEAVLNQILEGANAYPPALFELADIDLKANRFEPARDKLEKMLAQDPKNAAVLLQLGLLHEKMGGFDKAAACYERAIEAQSKTNVVAASLCLAHNNLAYIYAEQGKTNALEHARKARDLAPSDPSVADTLGWVHYRRGEYADALLSFREAAEKLTASAEVAFHLGTGYYMLGEEGKARTALQRALELEPDFRGRQEAQRELEVLGIDVLKIDSPQSGALKANLAQHPKDPVILSRLGAYYERTSEVGKAIESYEGVLKTNPKSSSTLIALARLYSSQAQDLDSIEKAMVRNTRARDVAPNDPRVAASSSQLAQKIKDYMVLAEKNGHSDDALKAASKARLFWPEDVDFARALGRLKFDQNDFAGAIPPLRDVKRANKADADDLYRLGFAHYKNKAPNESETNLLEAIKLNLKGPHADEANKVLAELKKNKR